MEISSRKNIVVTGGGGDIAKAMFSILPKEKYNVFLPSRKELDVCDDLSVESYFNELHVDVLINNAGYIVPRELKDRDLGSELKTIDVNLSGVYRATISALKNNNDSLKIINIGSSAGTKARGAWGAYCATKAALIMLTKCWADEGVDVVCLSPGRTATKMRTSLFGLEETSELMKVEDFARVVYLAIEGKFEVGENIDVNLSNVRSVCEGIS